GTCREAGAPPPANGSMLRPRPLPTWNLRGLAGRNAQRPSPVGIGRPPRDRGSYDRSRPALPARSVTGRFSVRTRGAAGTYGRDRARRAAQEPPSRGEDHATVGSCEPTGSWRAVRDLPRTRPTHGAGSVQLARRRALAAGPAGEGLDPAIERGAHGRR